MLVVELFYTVSYKNPTDKFKATAREESFASIFSFKKFQKYLKYAEQYAEQNKRKIKKGWSISVSGVLGLTEWEWEKSEHDGLQSLESTHFLKISFPVW